MTATTRLLVVHARSPLHAGTGHATSAVDLPIARDRATHLPLLPGSSLKGSLRGRARSFTGLTHPFTHLFGPEKENASDHAGSLAFTDARLLLLPVRSVSGTFAWVTSPYLIACFARDARQAGVTLPACPAVAGSDCAITGTSALSMALRPGAPDRHVVLEEFDLTPAHDASALAKALGPVVFPGDDAWQRMLTARLCVVADDAMSFLARHGTELVTRVSIDPETGTANDGQLWTEENLPAETVLAGLVEELPPDRVRSGGQGAYLADLTKLTTTPIQLGGKATVGRGRCQIHLYPAEA
jgi:CRISPR-associated protein Cmr4